MFCSQTITSFSKMGESLKLGGGKSLSIYIKILINYSQMIGVIKDLQLKWPYYVFSFFNVIMNFGFISTGIVNIDCFVSDLQINTPTIYIKVLFTLTFYILFVIGGIAFFSFRSVVLRKTKQFNRFVMFFLVLSIMLQPNSIKEGTDLFVCQKVSDKSYLVKQMSEECYTEYHIDWVTLFFIINELF